MLVSEFVVRFCDSAVAAELTGVCAIWPDAFPAEAKQNPRKRPCVPPKHLQGGPPPALPAKWSWLRTNMEQVVAS